MVAPSSTLERSQVAARSSGSLTSLCAWSSLKTHVRSLAANNTTNTAGDLPAQINKSPARAVATSHLVAIVGGAVGAAIALALVLALMHVLRVRRKVERFRRSMNVLGPELTPMPPIVRPPDDVVIVDHVAVSQVSPSARLSLASEARLPDYQRFSYHSGGPESIGPPRGPPLPPRRLTIDVGASRAIHHTSHLSAGLPSHPYRGVVPSPGPTSFPRREPHSAAT